MMVSIGKILLCINYLLLITIEHIVLSKYLLKFDSNGQSIQENKKKIVTQPEKTINSWKLWFAYAIVYVICWSSFFFHYEATDCTQILIWIWNYEYIIFTILPIKPYYKNKIAKFHRCISIMNHRGSSADFFFPFSSFFLCKLQRKHIQSHANSQIICSRSLIHSPM